MKHLPLKQIKHKLLKLYTKENVKRSLIAVYFFLASAIVYHIAFAHRIIPGVKIGNVRVGGMNFNQAKQALQNYESKTQKTLTLTYGDKKFVINGDALSLTYNIDSSVSRAFEVGRTGNFFVDTKEKLAGLVKTLYVPTFNDYADNKLSDLITSIKGEINREPQNANVKMEDEKLEITPSSDGYKVIDDQLFHIIVDSFDHLSFGTKEIPVKHMLPTVLEVDVRPLLGEVEKVISNKLVITYGDKAWTLDQSQLLSFIEFDKAEDLEKAGNATSTKKPLVKISVNKPVLNAFIDVITQDVNVLPKGKVTRTDGNKVVDFEIIQTGKELDVHKFIDDFKDAFINAKPGFSLAMVETNPPSSKEKYGIFSLLGEGNSKYVGSSNARVHNLTLAAEKTNGVLVPPGSIYSLSRSVGDISAKNGFDAALIIREGRTVLGEGGGVCQTSTTLFRAVLAAGLPVVMRYPHAYRVYYYEQDRKPGFDAAIFQPSLDFQFRNDTPNYILVQAEPDPKNYALTFKLYGTPDGRTVELSEPIISSQFAPAEPLYIDNPNLPKGTLIQMEHPAWGAVVSFTRVVKKGDSILYNDTYSSRYQAWRAVYSRGTKE